ncbi:MAG: chemotaxis protein CheA [Woeseiaceae bacterium]
MDELDLQEVRGMFLEECRENVDVLESGLLKMGGDDADPELVNEVFRAAHSIKGGGATFGFMKLSELTHHMETLLDEMRQGNKTIQEADLELLLGAVDIVRDLMELTEKDEHPERIAMQEKLAGAVGSQPDEPEVPEETQNDTSKIWGIDFKPAPELLVRGNDPLLLVREVHRLGELTLSPQTDALPNWADFDPKSCYLGFTAELVSQCDEEAITEIFEWIEFDCQLDVTLMPLRGAKETTIEAAETAVIVDDKVAASDSTGQATKPIESETPRPVVTSASTQEKANESAPPKVTTEAAEAEPAKPAPAKPPAAAESTSIRIATDKIDQMINLVGELVITQSMLNRIGEADSPPDADELRDRLAELERNTRELQESVMRVRMMPMSSGFGRLPRLVRDLSRKLDKKVELKIEGGQTEIDKTVLERMMDPLVHLVRNALDHGLETPSERLAAGKSETGELTLNAFHKSGAVIIEIVDDGHGIDRDKVFAIAVKRGVVSEDDELTDDQINQLIFAPGFSTAALVSDVSGRGVGMDVVRRNILDLGGRIEIKSVMGEGTTIRIRLPLTLAILEGQMIGSAGQVFVIPLLSIIETVEMTDSGATRLPGSGEVCRFRGEFIPLIYLSKRLRLRGKSSDELVVIVEVDGQLIGIAIDEVLGQQQVVIKALEDNYRTVPGIAGATIMSDGSVALIIDPPALSGATNALSEVA